MTKTIFITGGSRGIGEALVRLAAGKMNVAFTYFKNAERGAALKEELKEYGGVLAIECDVRDKNSVLSAIDTAKARFGKIDILVNNAGVACDGLVIDLSEDEWRDCFAVNVDGVFNTSKAVLPDMLSRRSGCIVNVSSVWGIHGASNEVAYSAAKAAVIGFTKALAKEVAPSGVRVNCVAPGAIDTDMMRTYTHAEVEDLCKNSIPLGRLGTPAEVASAVLFLAQNEYISGAVLSVDGLLS
ncbi:MAG: 3-oxoacyl-ACP reductase FabG [Clostridia bacterium]|nr:3-oxoacyl-ACP reductase FabG [Clostridia bacterium]